jgi:hypothetical protein
VNTDGQVFGHLAVFDTLDDDTLKGLAPVLKFFIVVELGAVKKATCPCKDRGNRVG